MLWEFPRGWKLSGDFIRICNRICNQQFNHHCLDLDMAASGTGVYPGGNDDQPVDVAVPIFTQSQMEKKCFKPSGK